MKQAYVKGTDIRIVGSLDTIQARANIVGFEDDGTPIWEGETKVFWDSQQTVTNEAGQPMFLTWDGAEYSLDQIELRDEEAAS
jgi:hypothetical protein